jgi:4'-phosphopantetheinyl transferase
MIELYAIQFKEQLPGELFDYLLQFVEKAEKIKRFLKWEDSYRALYAELLIRYIIISKLKIKNETISFSTNEYKKPFLDNVKDFHFNLSHSGNWIVCATDNQPIGIDVERIRTVDFKMAKRFFSQQESDELFQKDETKKNDFFFTLWTFKESYIKAIGKGLYLPLSSFTVKFIHEYKIGIIIDGKLLNDIHLKMYPLDKDYKLSVCASHEQFPESITIKGINAIINYFSKE